MGEIEEGEIVGDAAEREVSLPPRGVVIGSGEEGDEEGEEGEAGDGERGQDA